jgi:hypothetical protein
MEAHEHSPPSSVRNDDIPAIKLMNEIFVYRVENPQKMNK